MLFLGRNQKPDTLGALVTDAGNAIAAKVRRTRTDPFELEALTTVGTDGSPEQKQLLRQVIQQARLNTSPCTTLLEIGDYQLLLVEAPEVPPAELKAAIRWRIRELIDFQIDDAIIDVFDAPPSGVQGIQKHLYVVVARNTLVQKKIAELTAAGARIEIVDIPELALRNIASRLPEDATGVALLHLEPERGLITITRDATLYLARTLNIGYRSLVESSRLMEQVSLEIQRTLDYYESHFLQAPISTVVITPLPAGMQHLAESLHEQLGLTCRETDLSEIVHCGNPPPGPAVGPAFLALGAALRQDATQL